ncbi:MAG: protein translocase subunit SecDF [Prolixibacteraceae bacterium]|nr:protein translocase subunit SecDF [Prolixibacteraceae bacterium]
MQNKGAILTLIVLLFAVSLYQLGFTFKTAQVEKRAKEYAQGNNAIENAYLDSISGEPVYSFLGLKKFTYQEVKGLELNLGLDLKGGMNVTLEVSVVDVIRALSNYSADSTFNAALARATQMQKNSTQDYVTLFGEAFEQIDPNAKLAAVFNTLELKDKVKFNSTNAEVLNVIRAEADVAIDNSFNILRTRIDRFGVAQPNIQQLQTRGRILIELPGIDNPERVRKLLQGTAQLEFWETHENEEVYPYLLQANQKLREIRALDVAVPSDSTDVATPFDSTADNIAATDSLSTSSLIDELKSDSTNVMNNPENLENFRKEFPLFAVLSPSTNEIGQLMSGPTVGIAQTKDTARVNEILNMEQIRNIFPRNMMFRWSAKSMDPTGKFYRLIALKVNTRDGKAPLVGDVITDAKSDFDQYGRPEVSMSMNSEGAKTWARLTKENIGKSIAIVLDGYVRSFPSVMNEITGGRSSITGLENVEESQDLANILKSGKMPAPAHIIQEDVVGPSLGKEAISSGMYSFLIAFVVVLVYMFFFYSHKAGLAANIALISNVFFIFGILASLGAVLTLPGIAGIVLTIGMAIDANVLIYERVQEELNGGKSLKLAISDGYKNAYSAIIDGLVTTLLTGIVLYIFGSGPIKGFATTLVIGILTSLFSAIFITRLIFEWQLKHNKKITFTAETTRNWLRNTKIDFLDKRKMAYIISGCAILLSLISFAVRGFNLGIDFKGGRTYVVRFDEDVKVSDVQQGLAKVFEMPPEVKTFGGNNQIRVTTTYKIDDMSDNADDEVEGLLYKGLTEGGFISSNVSFENFSTNYRLSSQKVGPTISHDIQRDAIIAVLFSLVIIFLYILLRFRNWQYGLGAIVALAHDAIIVLGVFSALHSLLPFSLEIDQAFIAAILTVLGYSINDTVVIFDRIREYIKLYPKRELGSTMNHATNSTLRRTFSTSISTFVVVLAIFLFGGATIRGFTFALLVGIAVGTYSSLFVASPLVYDLKTWALSKTGAKSKK